MIRRNVFRAGNMWANQETLFPQQKCFWICWETFLLPGKQILFPQQCFPGLANWETWTGSKMFPEQCFLVCPGRKCSLPCCQHVILFKPNLTFCLDLHSIQCQSLLSTHRYFVFIHFVLQNFGLPFIIILHLFCDLAYFQNCFKNIPSQVWFACANWRTISRSCRCFVIYLYHISLQFAYNIFLKLLNTTPKSFVRGIRKLKFSDLLAADQQFINM